MKKSGHSLTIKNGCVECDTRTEFLKIHDGKYNLIKLRHIFDLVASFCQFLFTERRVQ